MSVQHMKGDWDNMKKYLQIVLLVALVLVIVGGIVAGICFAGFMKPGVHRFMGYTRLDFQEKVYFVNADSKEVSGSSTVTVSGIVLPAKSSGASDVFRGSMSVAQYSLPLDTGYGDFSASVSEGVISISRMHDERFAQENVTYWLQMSEKDPSIYAVHIYFADGTSVTAYPGETEQEAIANCEAYWQWFRK